MIKKIPLDTIQIVDSLFDSNDEYKNAILSLFKDIYSEFPGFWKNGLNLDLFNGCGDKIFLLKKDGNIIGFIGLQKYRLLPNNCEDNDYANYISIGILPQYRGNGIATYALNKILSNGDLNNLYWLCNKNNKASIKLFLAINKILNNKIKLLYDE